mmetsp:Transcript_100576/g.284907  ORF Transcript_100576/g.284907 Transcript_100576/m.284907 type:complete len:204 (-) Transcript_100576:1148-1759(-)
MGPYQQRVHVHRCRDDSDDDDHPCHEPYDCLWMVPGRQAVCGTWMGHLACVDRRLLHEEHLVPVQHLPALGTDTIHSSIDGRGCSQLCRASILHSRAPFRHGCLLIGCGDRDELDDNHQTDEGQQAEAVLGAPPVPKAARRLRRAEAPHDPVPGTPVQQDREGDPRGQGRPAALDLRPAGRRAGPRDARPMPAEAPRLLAPEH